MERKGKLYIVSTPIGNLGDITLRALDVLKRVDVILCEDTRHTKRLLHHYVIQSRTESFHAHSIGNREDRIIQGIRDGKHYALVSDAGTPLISDPGGSMVGRILEELGSEYLEVIPGPSALVSALVRSGIPGNSFVFLGYVPSKKGRETFFKRLSHIEGTVAFYESKHKIMKTLESLVENLSHDRVVSLVRELTKIHEETIRGTAAEVLSVLKTYPEKQKGEFTLVISSKRLKGGADKE